MDAELLYHSKLGRDRPKTILYDNEGRESDMDEKTVTTEWQI